MFLALCREVPGHLLNEEAWRLAQVLQVGSTLYDIDYNPPTVDKVGAAPPAGDCRCVRGVCGCVGACILNRLQGG